MADDDGDLIARHADAVMKRLQSLHEASRDDPDRFSRASRYKSDMADSPAPEPPFVLHDDDYCVFRHFNDEDGLIIDIGANGGYSAESIWASGSGARILSFEALDLHEQNLAARKHAYGDKFDYRILGLSNSSAVLEFIAPVVNNVVITGLATAWSDVHWPSFAENTIRFGGMEAYRNNRPVEVDLAFIQAPVMTLDEALQSMGLNLEGTNICAIKIDVEGLEPEVVAGALETLSRQKPLLLIEAVRYRKQLLQMLKDTGYRFAGRNGDQLEPVEELPPALNTFFWHVDQRRHYESIGLFARKRSSPTELLRNWLNSAVGR